MTWTCIKIKVRYKEAGYITSATSRKITINHGRTEQAAEYRSTNSGKPSDMVARHCTLKVTGQLLHSVFFLFGKRMRIDQLVQS